MKSFRGPDYRQIERNVKEASSSYYYPKLLEKYLNSDANHDTRRGRHLYFGYVYQPNYIPSDTSRYNQIASRCAYQSSFSDDDLNRILEYSESLLKEDPFNLRAFNARMLVYAQHNDTEAYRLSPGSGV